MPALTLALLSALATQEPEPAPPTHPAFLLPAVDAPSAAPTQFLGRKTLVLHFASW